MEITQEGFVLNYKQFNKSSIGIYKIQINNHVYIGSTTGRYGFSTRWSKHCSQLKNNTHHSIIMQNCFNKYKQANFEIVAICDKQDCIKLEQYYIDTLNPDMNVCRVAKSCTGIKQSKQTIEKRVLKLIGQKRTLEHKLKMSESAKGRILTEQQKLNMSKARKDKPLTEEHKINIGKSLMGRKMSAEAIEASAKSRRKPILQYTKDMIFLKEWSSTTNASKELDIKITAINACLNNKSKTSGGYIWKYKTNNA